ncbi:MAG: ATP-grasp domain-containing protein [Isosphaeraceae bacterium]
MNVLILGASARAAAHSALRAGLSPFAIDLFGDLDLRAVSPAVRVAAEEYPEALFRAADALPPCPWLYTGGLENRPDLVDALAARRPLWGVSGESLRGVRDPLAVSRALLAAGLLAPAVSLDPPSEPGNVVWLEKPLGSSGGTGIRAVSTIDARQGRSVLHIAGDPADDRRSGNSTSQTDRPDVARRTERTQPSYYQQWVAGDPASAVFLGDGSTAILAGVTRQLVGRPGAEFGYRGTIAPWPVSTATACQIDAVGRTLARGFGLAGLFGVDLILDAEGQPWTIEVNPRYTASVEILEFSRGTPWLTAHRKACEGRPVETWQGTSRDEGLVAKEIVYATGPVIFRAGPEDMAHLLARRGPFELPAAADIPEDGCRFETGDPVATVFGRGATVGGCLDRLDAAARDLRRHLLPDSREETGS